MVCATFGLSGFLAHSFVDFSFEEARRLFSNPCSAEAAAETAGTAACDGGVGGGDAEERSGLVQFLKTKTEEMVVVKGLDGPVIGPGHG